MKNDENISEDTLANNDELTLMEMRSTYAPRTIKVLAIRSVDIIVKILNLSFLERLIKYNFNHSIGVLLTLENVIACFKNYHLSFRYKSNIFYNAIEKMTF